MNTYNLSNKKKAYLPKGYFTMNNKPTQYAVFAYTLLYIHDPLVMITKKRNDVVLNKIKKELHLPNNVNIWPMLLSGMSNEWVHSKTSYKRVLAMRSASDYAKSIIGGIQGVELIKHK